MTYVFRALWRSSDGTAKRFTRRCTGKPIQQKAVNPVTGDIGVHVADTGEQGEEIWARFFAKVEWYELEEIADA